MLTVTQPDFLWILSNMNCKITQTPEGIVMAQLRKNIQIIHEYKKNNRMEIRFLDDESRYIINDKNSLNEILKIHLLNETSSIPIKEYCDNNLKKC